MSTDRDVLGSVSSKASSMFSCGKKGKSTGSLRPGGEAQSSFSTSKLCWGEGINVLFGVTVFSLSVFEKRDHVNAEVKQKKESKKLKWLIKRS